MRSPAWKWSTNRVIQDPSFSGASCLCAGARKHGTRARTLEAVNPTAEEKFWRETYVREPYYMQGRTYEYYAPGFRAGWEGRVLHDGRTFEEAELALKANYDLARTEPGQKWEDVRPAARAAWNRVDHGWKVLR